LKLAKADPGLTKTRLRTNATTQHSQSNSKVCMDRTLPSHAEVSAPVLDAEYGMDGIATGVSVSANERTRIKGKERDLGHAVLH